MAFGDGLLVGSSVVMREVRKELLDLAHHDVPVYLRGETGSGKGAAARFLHETSAWARGPFVKLSMTMLTPGLEVDRFVGHAAGAFTDAKSDLPGAVEAAHGGSLLLDEIGDASPTVQGILLHVLEDQEILRQGEHRPRAVDVRVIVATNRDLEQAVHDHTLREDLYFRLPSLGLVMPPLRAHLDDLPELADALLGRASKRYRCAPRPLGTRELDRLAVYSWPGNVRELDRALLHWLVRGTLPAEITSDPSMCSAGGRSARARIAVAVHDGNKSAAARELGVSRVTLNRWLADETGIARPTRHALTPAAAEGERESAPSRSEATRGFLIGPPDAPERCCRRRSRRLWRLHSCSDGPLEDND